MYNIQYFINFFSQIPEENFLVRKYRECEKGCAMGLLQDNLLAHSTLYNIGNKYFRSASSTSIIDINNGDHPQYQQPTPKQRILAALYDIKKMEQKPEYQDITLELALQA